MVDRKRCLENVRTLEEERPLLGEKDREALICSYDRRVRFDLGKIGIDRRIESDIRRYRVLQRYAYVAFDRLINESARDRVGSRESSSGFRHRNARNNF